MSHAEAPRHPARHRAPTGRLGANPLAGQAPSLPAANRRHHRDARLRASYPMARLVLAWAEVKPVWSAAVRAREKSRRGSFVAEGPAATELPRHEAWRLPSPYSSDHDALRRSRRLSPARQPGPATASVFRPPRQYWRGSHCLKWLLSIAANLVAGDHQQNGRYALASASIARCATHHARRSPWRPVKMISGRRALEFQRNGRLSIPTSGAFAGWRKSAAEESFVKGERR